MDILRSPDAPNQVCLLTLPRAELDVAKANSNDTPVPTSSPSLLLLQLPLNWSASDLMHSISNNQTDPNTYFVANEPSQHVACIVESKGCSFSVHRVETSNVFVLVPPKSSPNGPHNNYSATYDENSNVRHQVDDTIITHPPKKSKVAAGTDPVKRPMTHVPAHLLKRGGSGSYFLELRPKRLRSADIRSALHAYVFDPYAESSTTDPSPNTTTRGRTILDLATSLQVSHVEIQHGLTKIHAFAIPRTNPTQYGMVANHILQDCYTAIIDGLILIGSQGDDYGGVGIDETSDLPFATYVVQQIFSKEERFPDVDSVIHHCLQSLQKSTTDKEPFTSSGTSHSNQYVLDVSKVRNSL
jgi:Sister chromatid cohesion protein Dcc1